MFDRIEKEKKIQAKIRLGLLKGDEVTPDGQVAQKLKNKKPRPKDLISNKVSIGKWGPRQQEP